MQIVESRKTIVFNKLYVILTALLLLSTILGGNFNGINSVCTILLVLTSIAELDFHMKWQRLKSYPVVYFITFYFLLYLLSILISKDKHEAFSMVQREFVIAFVLFSKRPFSKTQTWFLLKLFVYGTFCWMCFATVMAAKAYFSGGDLSVFLYHTLALNVGSTAIFASFLCIISVAIILFIPATNKWKIILYACFTIWLLLLSSRMFLLIHLIISGTHLFTHLSIKYRLLCTGAMVALVGVLCVTQNPVKSRFQDMKRFQATYLTQPSFNDGIYFDGLSLRLIYIRFSLEIMKEHNSYLLGVGTGDAATLLRNKIRANHMYIGDGSNSNKGGYLQYSFHDAYLESFVAFGIVGVLAILLLFGYVGYWGIKTRMGLARDLFIIITLSSFTDVIVVNDQCDLALVITICYLAMTLPPPYKNNDLVPSL